MWTELCQLKDFFYCRFFFVLTLQPTIIMLLRQKKMSQRKKKNNFKKYYQVKISELNVLHRLDFQKNGAALVVFHSAHLQQWCGIREQSVEVIFTLVTYLCEVSSKWTGHIWSYLLPVFSNSASGLTWALFFLLFTSNQLLPRFHSEHHPLKVVMPNAFSYSSFKPWLQSTWAFA